MSDSPLRRAIVVLGGISALLAALLGAMQVDASRKSSHASAEGSRLAVKAVEEVTSAGLRLNLDASAIQSQDVALLRAGWLRVRASSGALAPVAAADARAEVRLRQAIESMLGTRLSAADLVAEDAALRARAEATVARQNAALARAESYGSRSGAASRALLLVATAAALLTLSGSLGGRRPAWLAVATAAALLCAAVGTGVLGLLA